MITGRAALVLALLALAGLARAAGEDVGARLDAYIGAASNTLSVEPRKTLGRIPNRDRRLLALRAYVRAGDSLDDRWTWSSDQVEAWLQSTEHQHAIDAIARVSARFAADNPGFTLYVNPDIRSLAVQVERWNSNASVGSTARALRESVSDELRDSSYPAVPDEESVERFRQFVVAWRPPSAATLAAPGLSAHGQARAFDFQIQRSGRTIAGPDSKTVRRVWEGKGWAAKLATAVRAAGEDFHGPLESPREPWHYEYRPAR